MKEILSALGLGENATPEQAIEKIQALKLAAKGLPSDIDPAALAAKIAAGLDKETAIEVLRSQAMEDAPTAKPGKKAKAG